MCLFKVTNISVHVNKYLVCERAWSPNTIRKSVPINTGDPSAKVYARRLKPHRPIWPTAVQTENTLKTTKARGDWYPSEILIRTVRGEKKRSERNHDRNNNKVRGRPEWFLSMSARRGRKVWWYAAAADWGGGGGGGGLRRPRGPQNIYSQYRRQPTVVSAL